MKGNGVYLETVDFLGAALEYARMGYRVFPLSERSKLPQGGSHGLLDATTDEEKIRFWWSYTPEANVGISTDGLLVLDIDGADNPWALADEERISSLNDAPCQRTGNRGLQVFFRQPEGRHWKNTASQVALNVDTRANGGYVVVPPSLLTEEKRYSWIPFREIGERNSLPLPPTWLTETLDGLGNGKHVVFEDHGEAIPESRRNVTLTRIAGQFRRFGSSEATIYAALTTINHERCHPPLPEREIRKISHSISSYQPDQITQMLAEGDLFSSVDEDLEEEYAPENPGPFPRHLLDLPGLIGSVIEHNLGTAHRQQPVLALGAALALMSTITGRKIQDVHGTQTNLYVIGLCESGGGKEHARKLNKAILQSSGWEELIGPEAIGSHAGLISSIEKEPAQLFQIDEIGRVLCTLRKPDKAPHLYNIITVLLRLFSSAGGLYIGDAYADLKKVKRIQWPHACLYGTTVPESFYDGLTVDSLTNGFLARLLVFESDEGRPPYLQATEEDPPKHVLEAVASWRDFAPGGNLGKTNPQPKRLTYSKEAEDFLTAFFARCELEAGDGKSAGVKSLWLRVAEKARKLGILYQASQDGPGVDQVSLQAARWGAELSEYLCRRLLFQTAFRLSDNDSQERIQSVYRAIREAGESGITRNRLTRRFEWYGKRVREEIIATLLEGQRILLEDVKTGGRPKQVFKVRRQKPRVHTDETDGCLS